MVTQYIMTRRILDLCERSAQRPGSRVSRRWLEQAGKYLEGQRKGRHVASDEIERIFDANSIHCKEVKHSTSGDS